MFNFFKGLKMSVVTFESPFDLTKMLFDVKGTSACSMELTTEIKHNVKCRTTGMKWVETFKGEVYRTYKEYGNFNFSYENAVNNQRVREGNTNHFTSAPLPWGEWVAGMENKVITHKGDFYLRYYVGMNANSKADKDVIYHYVDGTELTDEEIEMLDGFMPPPKPKSNTQEIVKEVEPRVVKMNGINALTVKGVTYARK